MATSAAPLEIPAELDQVLKEIDDCREYESSVDPDDPRVSEDTIQAATDLVTRAFTVCRQNKVCWTSPTVSVTPDARIHITWGQRGNWASWRVGSHDAPVVLVVSRQNAEPTRQEVSSDQAIVALLDFQRGCDCA